MKLNITEPFHLRYLKRSIAIHQPEHMPWGGFFNKMCKCDVFVILDSVQFAKNNWQNRNQFIDRQGNRYWLTVPVKLKNHIQKEFREVEIVAEGPWRRKYLNSLKMNYASFSSFYPYFGAVEEILSRPYVKLVDLNMALITYFRKLFDINNQIVFASSLGVTGNKNALLVNICKKLGATSYISGLGGQAYLDPLLFKENGIDLVFNEFPSNGNIWEEVHENISVLDILFRNGIRTMRAYVLN